ncbi:: Unstab_antitox [Gemmataceae bacterium]|nr:: Unstab_antitox [Gemmataceae bacterium]VTU01881.1 : Unstab_antitox [Gemmataceae bacterium]
MGVDAILKEVEALSDAERAELLSRLTEQYEPVELSDELKAELDRRDAAYEANPNRVYTWDEVVACVKRKKP